MTDMQMMMGMGMQVQMQMKASPALIALNNMLILSTLELQQMIQQELEENPALELVESEEAVCQRCGRPLTGPTCIACLQEDMRMMESEREDFSLPADDDEFDPLMLVAAPPTLSDNLVRDLHASLPKEEHFIADYLIGSLDEQGYLDTTIEELVATVTVDPERLELVLLKFQELAPVDVVARHVHACLLSQLRRVPGQPARHA